ncbi:hypothetical protein B0681_06170 [Moraxella porci DSM 25326]|uniref:Uncharacterized protein n=1 Tax=Moraxella porci DSM 25326 TaxID=573983 RepID=A0A1T0CRS0_9GAMM|nr:hypothetical protein B0681_06170 [Moraxella porci DSM 25326]
MQFFGLYSGFCHTLAHEHKSKQAKQLALSPSRIDILSFWSFKISDKLLIWSNYSLGRWLPISLAHTKAAFKTPPMDACIINLI